MSVSTIHKEHYRPLLILLFLQECENEGWDLDNDDISHVLSLDFDYVRKQNEVSEMTDLQIHKAPDGELFGIRNVMVKQDSNDKIILQAEIAGHIPSAEKYLEEKGRLMEELMKEEREILK